jgi:hypothetical protein
MYKKISIIALLSFTILTSCIKQDNVVLTNTIVELDMPAFNANFGSLLYPFTTRQPLPGRAVLGADAFITRSSATATFRVNLVGAQRNTPTNVNYKTFLVGSDIGASVTYGSPISGVLNTFDAVAGTHYTAASGVCVIPANTSFGTITIPILNTGITANTTALLGIELVDGADVTASANYKKLAFGISQK